MVADADVDGSTVELRVEKVRGEVRKNKEDRDFELVEK